MCQLLGMNSRLPASLTLSFTGFSQRGGCTDHHADGWGIAFFEYLVQVPANRIGYSGNSGPFTLIQLKIIQEVITLVIFLVFTLLIFKTETIRWNHLVSMVFIIIAVFFAFKK